MDNAEAHSEHSVDTVGGTNRTTVADLAAGRPWWLLVLGVAGASLVLGGLTSFAQTFLPEALTPLANSSSGWTVLTALLVWLARPSTRVGAVLGAISFVGLVVGYGLISNARGYYFNPLFWSAIGLATGPFIGAAAAWQRCRGWPRALAAGLLAGITIGEGVYGLTVVRATTGWFYWTASVLVGLVVAVMAAARIRRVGPVVLELAALTAVAVALNLVYRRLLS